MSSPGRNPAADPEAGRRDRNGPSRHFERVLMAALLATILGVFYFCALSHTDWEILSTKHYWAPGERYYGGFAWPLVETSQGYRTLQKEGLANYTNLLALEEVVSPEKAQHRVEGYPGTERLAVSFILYVLLHATGRTLSIWTLFWLMSVGLWLLAILLTYRIAQLFYADRYSPWFAAMLVTMYPVLTLTFNTIKVQPLGTVYLLLGIFTFERYLKTAGFCSQVLGLTGLIFFGLFASGGWFYTAAFICLRAWWLEGRSKWMTLVALGLGVMAAKLALGGLTRIYYLPSVEQELAFSFSRMAGESASWLRTWIQGGNVHGLKFANFAGSTFFTGFLPLIIRSFVTVHALLLLVAMLGLFVEPRSRIFAFLVLPMFLVGHSGHILAAWIYHYGYMSFPAGLMAIFAAAGTLGWMATRRRLFPFILAVGILAGIGAGFLSLKKQAGIYYGGDAGSFQQKLYIYYGNETEPLTY
jgi:hypothetical protein